MSWGENRMSTYTTQLRWFVESGGNVFDFDYPIFDSNYRSILEKKIIDHYYFREIGLETIAQFKHFLKVKLNTIMPYYNQLYETTGLITKDDYNINLNTVEKHSRTVDSTSTTNSNTTAKGSNVFSDTPQAKLQDLDYATSLNEDDSEATGESTGSAKTTEEFIIELSGGGGVRYNSDVLMEWRKTFLNIDKMIIDELNDLFMNVY
jgi:hypothetical protein